MRVVIIMIVMPYQGSNWTLKHVSPDRHLTGPVQISSSAPTAHIMLACEAMGHDWTELASVYCSRTASSSRARLLVRGPVGEQVGQPRSDCCNRHTSMNDFTTISA